MNAKTKRYLMIVISAGIVAISISLAAPLFRPVYRFFAQFPGVVYWITLPIPIGLVAAYILARAWGEGEVEAEERKGTVGTGELLPLAERIEQGEDSEFSRARLVYEISELAARLTARRYGIGLAEARERVRNGDWTDDQSIRLIHGRDSGLDPYDRFAPALEEAVLYLERFYEEV